MDLLRVLRVLDSASCQTRWPVSPPHQLPRMSSRLLLEIHWMPPPTNMDQLLSFELSLFLFIPDFLPSFFSLLSFLGLVRPFRMEIGSCWLPLRSIFSRILQTLPLITRPVISNAVADSSGDSPRSFVTLFLFRSFFSFLFFSLLFVRFIYTYYFLVFHPPPFLAPLEIVS